MPPIKKRSLLWDYTNTQSCPSQLSHINLSPTTSPISSLANWNTWTPPELLSLPVYLPFRPMIRTPAPLEGSEYDNLLSSITTQTNLLAKNGNGSGGGEVIIHYLNEPERIPISPSQTVDLWTSHIPNLKAQFPNLKIVGPACASDPAGQAWFSEFLELLKEKDEMVDYVGVHWYGDSVDDAISFLSGIHEKFGDMEMVVSEIACTSRDYSAVKTFNTELCNWMDNQDWIFEYGFFGCMKNVADGFVSPAAQLMNPDGSFNELMNMYMGDTAGGA